MFNSTNIRTVDYGITTTETSPLNWVVLDSDSNILISSVEVKAYLRYHYYDWKYLELVGTGSITGLASYFDEFKDRTAGLLKSRLEALKLEYDPIENYHGYEKTKDTIGSRTSTTTNSGSDTVSGANSNTIKSGGSDTEAHNIGATNTSNTNKIIPYNSTSLVTSTENDEVTPSHNDSVTTNYGKVDTESASNSSTTVYGHAINTNDSSYVDEHELEKWGNMGVTTSQTMLLQELEVRRKDEVRQYLDDFIKEYCFYI